jgi:hypothetical protein
VLLTLNEVNLMNPRPALATTLADEGGAMIVESIGAGNAQQQS